MHYHIVSYFVSPLTSPSVV